MVGTLPQVPFAKDRSLIANFLQQFGEGLQAIVEMGVERRYAIDVIVGAGEDGGTAGRTDTVGAETVVKTHPAIGDTIQIGRLIDAAAVTTHGMGGMVVRHDKDDVGPLIELLIRHESPLCGLMGGYPHKSHKCGQPRLHPIVSPSAPYCIIVRLLA